MIGGKFGDLIQREFNIFRRSVCSRVTSLIRRNLIKNGYVYVGENFVRNEVIIRLVYYWKVIDSILNFYLEKL